MNILSEKWKHDLRHSKPLVLGITGKVDVSSVVTTTAAFALIDNVETTSIVKMNAIFVYCALIVARLFVFYTLFVLKLVETGFYYLSSFDLNDGIKIRP